MHCFLTFWWEFNAPLNNICLQAYNNALIVELCLFGWRLGVHCFVAYLSLYFSCCTIYICYRSIGRQHVTIAS